MTEMQRQFEEWLSINTPCCSEYNRQQIEWLMWQAWQAAWTASRAAIAVTLPETHNDWLDKQIVQHALQQEGIRYE